MIWLTQAGRIADDLWLLGRADVPVYLLRIDEARYALVEGGLSTDAETIWTQILQFARPEQIHYWVVTHKHYDHCGALASLMPRLPNASLIVSRMTFEAWQSRACRRFIANANGALCNGNESAALGCLNLDKLPARCVHPGQEVYLGSQCTLTALAAPGHSDDSTAWYDSARQRLFAGDAAGEYDPHNRQWRPLIFSDVLDYLTTLESWLNLPVKQLIPGHGGCLISQEKGNIILAILEDCLAFIDSHKDTRADQRAQRATDLHKRWRKFSERFVQPDIHLASMDVMLAKIAGYSISDKEEVF